MFRAIEVCTDLTKRKKASIRNLLTFYRKTARKIAVAPVLESFISNMQSRFKKIVLDKEVKKFLENLSSEWFVCLWCKARALLAGLPATVTEPKVWGKSILELSLILLILSYLLWCGYRTLHKGMVKLLPAVRRGSLQKVLKYYESFKSFPYNFSYSVRTCQRNTSYASHRVMSASKGDCVLL